MAGPVKCPNDMCPIPAGTFKMGSTNGDPDEQPVREIELSAYKMMKHPVTVREYRAYLAEKGEGDRFKALIKGCGADAKWRTVENKKGQGKVKTRKDAAGLLRGKIDGKKVCEAKIETITPASMLKLDEGFDGDDQPMVEVSWPEADAYCKFYGMELPSEAQWERGARDLAGDKEYGTSSGTRARLSKEAHVSARETAPVCSYAENEIGLCDMAGQVWEWTRDVYQDSYEGLSSKDPCNNPPLPESQKDKPDKRNRVLRGGSWYFLNPRFLRAAYRYDFLPAVGYCNVGFRCVAAPQDSKK